jgi:predicted aldo/keto reductase-like oxidoreductase
VDSVLISIRTFEHVDEYLQASGRTLTTEDEKMLATYNRAVDDQFCRIGCTACEGRCPHGVAVGDIMRYAMYYENYGEQKQAILEYAALPQARRADPCARCDGPCEAACPHRLAVRDRLRRYDRLLRV